MNTRTWLLLAAMALLALPASAQYYDVEPVTVGDGGGGGGGGAWSGSYDYGTGTYLDNPCTAIQDWVYVSYNVYLEQVGMKMATNDRYLLAETMTMAGSYAASGKSNADVTYKGEAFSSRQYHKVTSTYDAFHVVTVIDVDPATQQTTVSIETACGNGMPDSKE